MSFNKTLIALGLSAMAFSAISMAADPEPAPTPTFDHSTGTVDFTGNIVNTPCAITATNQNLKVNLDNVKSSEFADGKGSVGNQEIHPFTLVLSNCTVVKDQPYKATVTFTGLGNSDDTALLVNAGQDTSGQPVAQGVGVQIIETNTNTPIILRKAGAEVVIDQTEMHLNYGARYIATSDTVVAGLANAHADFSVSYD